MYWTLYISSLVIVIFPPLQAVIERSIWLNHKSLTKQPLFWAAICWPCGISLGLGSHVWIGRAKDFSVEGYATFIEISKLPLGVLAVAIPLTAVIAAMHRSIQTAKQIESAEHKSQDDAEERIQATALLCLEKAFDLLNKEGKISKNKIDWETAEKFLDDYKNKYNEVKEPEIKKQTEVHKKYWEAKFQKLLMQMSKDDFILSREEGVSELTMSKIADFCGSSKIKHYIDKTKSKVLGIYGNTVIVSDEYADPAAISEHEITKGASDDPIVEEERRKRGLS